MAALGQARLRIGFAPLVAGSGSEDVKHTPTRSFLLQKYREWCSLLTGNTSFCQEVINNAA
jgi:hypothetical protein